MNGILSATFDAVPTQRETWNDAGRFEVPQQATFAQLVCNGCGGEVFSVLKTQEYETSARCVGCGRWFAVHCG